MTRNPGSDVPAASSCDEQFSPRGNRDKERREILLKLGKMAKFTGPTMITLLLSQRASAASPSSYSGGFPPGDP